MEQQSNMEDEKLVNACIGCLDRLEEIISRKCKTTEHVSRITQNERLLEKMKSLLASLEKGELTHDSSASKRQNNSFSSTKREPKSYGSKPRVLEVENSNTGEFELKTDAPEFATAASNVDVNILIVDDDEIAAKLLGKKLEKLNFRYEYVLTGIAAIEKLFGNPDLFDLVLCDVNMPGLDGGQVLHRILQTPHLSNLPIVMISSDDDLNKAQSLVMAGAKDYLTKPIKSSMLVSLTTKLKVWRAEQIDMARHLSAVYGTTHSFLLHLRVKLTTSVSDSDRIVASVLNDGFIDGANNLVTREATEALNLHTQGESPVAEVIILNASVPMRKLLGITSETICKGIDALKFVPEEDVESLKNMIFESIEGDVGVRKKMLFRWISHRSGEYIPVVGTWTVLGQGENNTVEMVVESKSLLPTLILNDEKEKRIYAEKRAIETGEALARLRKLYDTSQKVSEFQNLEFQNLMGELAQFSRLVTENPAVLIWRVRVSDRKVEFVSSQSCLALLDYSAESMKEQTIYDTLYSEDRPTLEHILGDIGRSGRIRRIARHGAIKWLESSSYSWWEKSQKIIVLTEYDITRYMMKR